jgi:hypothetical protein
MPENPDLGEQALNKVAEIGLASQLDAIDNLDVDAVTIEGEGMVMQQDLRMESMEMHISSAAINPLGIAFGKIELTKSTTGNAQIVLTEADINRAFNSEYIREKLQNQRISINNQTREITPQKVEFKLLDEGRIALNATILLVESNENHQIAFSAVPSVGENGQKIFLENVEYGESAEISPELTQALVEQTSQILNLKNFDLPGMNLRVQQLEIAVSKLILQVEADIAQISFSEK